MSGFRVLAFDPGYGRTGWAVLQESRSSSALEALGFGLIETSPADELPLRLHAIYKETIELIEEFSPTAVVMEKLFWKASTTTAPSVFQAQGVILSAAGQAGLSCTFLAPTAIKKAVAGSGRASKAEVERMLRRILDLGEAIRQDDTADALAAAIAGIQTLRFEKLRQRQGAAQ